MKINRRVEHKKSPGIDDLKLSCAAKENRPAATIHGRCISRDQFSQFTRSATLKKGGFSAQSNFNR
jgi:hypothetical protein